MLWVMLPYLRWLICQWFLLTYNVFTCTIYDVAAARQKLEPWSLTENARATILYRQMQRVASSLLLPLPPPTTTTTKDELRLSRAAERDVKTASFLPKLAADCALHFQVGVEVENNTCWFRHANHLWSSNHWQKFTFDIKWYQMGWNLEPVFLWNKG